MKTKKITNQGKITDNPTKNIKIVTFHYLNYQLHGASTVEVAEQIFLPKVLPNFY